MTDNLIILAGNRTLNWKKHLEDENFQADLLRFQQGDFQKHEDSEYINADIPRTRQNDPFLKEPHNQELFKKMATAYCALNDINYVSGLLELMAPFFLLHSSGFSLELCYAYFASFARKYYPLKFLALSTDSYAQRSKILQNYHSYIDDLIAYHSSQASNALKNFNIDSKLFAYPWIMTYFCLNTELELTYEILDHFFSQEDPYFLAYLVTATIIIKEDVLHEKADGDFNDLFSYLSRELQSQVLKDRESVSKVFHLARELKEKTPRTFENSLYQFFAKENEPVIKKTSPILEVYPSEIVDFWLRKKAFNTENQPVNPNGLLELQILDCRSVLGRSHLPYSISLPPQFRENQETNLIFERICDEFSSSHICLLQSSDEENEQEKINIQNSIIELRKLNRKHVSIIKGGFNGILAEMRHRNIDTTSIENKKVSLFKRFIGFLSK